MEHIPVTHAAILGMFGVSSPARVVRVWSHGLELELDLTRIAPGRNPKLAASLWFRWTLALEVARSLRVDDPVTVVLIKAMIEADGIHPYVSLPADPNWLTWNNETVRRLAGHIHNTGETHLLPILADALEDAACTDEALLTHCREPRPEAAWSWAVELLATQQ